MRFWLGLVLGMLIVLQGGSAAAYEKYFIGATKISDNLVMYTTEHGWHVILNETPFDDTRIVTSKINNGSQEVVLSSIHCELITAVVIMPLNSTEFPDVTTVTIRFDDGEILKHKVTPGGSSLTMDDSFQFHKRMLASQKLAVRINYRDYAFDLTGYKEAYQPTEALARRETEKIKKRWGLNMQ